MNKKPQLWRTKSGVIVEDRGRTIVKGVEKVLAFRHKTGGFHGLLHLARLTKVRP